MMRGVFIDADQREIKACCFPHYEVCPDAAVCGFRLRIPTAINGDPYYLYADMLALNAAVGFMFNGELVYGHGILTHRTGQKAPDLAEIQARVTWLDTSNVKSIDVPYTDCEVFN